MKYTPLLLILLNLVLNPISAPAQDHENSPWTLFLGEQKRWPVPGLKRYSVGGPSFRAVAFGESLFIKAVKIGVSDLWVHFQDGRSEHRTLQVLPYPEKPLPESLERGLTELDETEVWRTGDRVLLRGPLKSDREARRIDLLKKAFSAQIIDETEPDPEWVQKQRAKLLAWIHAENLPLEIKDREDGGLRLLGQASGPKQKAALDRKARSLAPSIESEIESLGDTSPTVHFRVFLLEVQRSQLSKLGLQWPEIQAQAFQVSASKVRGALQLDLALQALEGEGSARVLSNPELVVRAPGEAELFAGGELPIRTNSQYFSNVAWKTYGLSLKLKVNQVAGSRVRLDIATEVSHLSETISDDKIPSLESNRMKTQVDADFGVPLFLSGLLKQKFREQARGLPALRSLPVLGALFGSEDWMSERSELLAILLPEKEPPQGKALKLRASRISPLGRVPFPRDFISPRKQAEIESNPNYPWNAFQGNVFGGSDFGN